MQPTVTLGLRVPPELSSRLKSQASREGLSANALAVRILDTGLAPEEEQTHAGDREQDLEPGGR
jgi:HicB family